MEVNDYLPDVQPWNPAATTWQDPRSHRLCQALIQAADGCQFSSQGLADRLGRIRLQRCPPSSSPCALGAAFKWGHQQACYLGIEAMAEPAERARQVLDA